MTSVILLLLTFLALQSSEAAITVGILTQLESKMEAWSLLSQTDFFISKDRDSLTESSNWAVEDAQEEQYVDFEALIHMVYKHYNNHHNKDNSTVNFRKVFFNEKTVLKDIIEAFTNNQLGFDAYLTGFLSNQINSYETKYLCDLVSEMSRTQSKPSLSWSCVLPGCKFAHERTDPSMLSLIPSLEDTAKAVITILRRFNWRYVAWFTTAWPLRWEKVCGAVEKELTASNYFIVQFHHSFTQFMRTNTNENTNFIRESNATTNNFEWIWKNVYSNQISVVLMCLPHAYGRQAKKHNLIEQLLWNAYDVDKSRASKLPYIVVDEKGIYGEEDTLEGNCDVKRDSSKPMPNKTSVSNDSINISQTLHKFSLSGQAHFNINKVELIKRSKYFKSNIIKNEISKSNEQNIHENVLIVTPLLNQTFPSIHKSILKRQSEKVDAASLAYLMDSIYLVFLSESFRNDKEEITNHSRLFWLNALSAKSENGFAGPLLFAKESLSRQLDYVVWDIQGSKQKIVSVMKLKSNPSEKYYKIQEICGIEWSQSGEPVKNHCYEDSVFNCLSPVKAFNFKEFLAALASGVCLNAVTFIIYTCIWKRKNQTKNVQGEHKLLINSADIKNISLPNKRPTAEMSQISRNARVSLPWCSQNAIGMYKEENVFLKCLNKEPIKMKRSATKYLQLLRDIRSENICLFYGLYLLRHRYYMVMEYGSKRSLNDVLKNKEFPLNWTFRVSLLRDLVKGMKFIHSSYVHCHGRLKSTNCIVDDRFVLKITDYGVSKMQSAFGMCFNEDLKSLLWTAPELLRDPSLCLSGTQKGDAFSFAIICQEVILLEEPYFMLNLPLEQLIEKLKNPPPLVRPTVECEDAPPALVQVMQECWHEQPDLRLSFSVVLDKMNEMSRGKYNIVDCMMKQLEKYSSHLEELVNERTTQLGEEKKKTEQLLMKMLPPSVARLLLANQKVVPESFEKCTIYFSDICGFTTIAHSSTPMQVVDFLNDLYTCFDAIIENHDVYKVETIGDAYMVSSGIPKVIGDRHAEEAALMALNIISATTTFRVRHLPNLELRIRIGIHSGSAVAGVVGLTMPRYCLFGDTINTASRLETTGFPSRIHISADTKELLDKSTKGFILQERGEIKLKGRGLMRTWWLLGVKGFAKPLPDPGDLQEPNHGLKINNSTTLNNKSLNNSNQCCNFNSCKVYKKTTGQQQEQHDNLRASFNQSRANRGSSFVVSTPLVSVPLATGKQMLPSDVKKSMIQKRSKH